MLQMCLDFYSSILVETPEYATQAMRSSWKQQTKVMSPIAQDDQPTYQGLLSDNSEFLSMIVSSCAWHTTDFLDINLDC